MLTAQYITSSARPQHDAWQAAHAHGTTPKGDAMGSSVTGSGVAAVAVAVAVAAAQQFELVQTDSKYGFVIVGSLNNILSVWTICILKLCGLNINGFKFELLNKPEFKPMLCGKVIVIPFQGRFELFVVQLYVNV
jgi:hypothetical protein